MSVKIKLIILMFGAFAFILPDILFAKIKDEKKDESKQEIYRGRPIELDEIIVTATRRKIPLKDAPVKVTVIDKNEIEKSTAQTIDDFLKHVPDINIRSSHRTEVLPRQVTLRGIPDQGKTLILIDGIPMNGVWHGWTDWSLIPTDAVERIEVVHGPASSLYGSGAMGGVINIITKKSKKPGETTFSSSYGNMNTWSINLSQSGQIDKFGYYIGGRFYQTEGYIAEKYPQPYNTKRDRTDWNATGKFMWLLDEKSSLSLGLLHSNEDVDRGRKYAHHSMATTLSYLTYEKEAENFTLTASIYGKYQDWKIDFDRPPKYNYVHLKEDFDLIDFGEMFKVSFLITKGNILTTGIDYKHASIHKLDRYQTVDREGETKGKQHLLSLFAQDEINLLNGKLIFTLGARGDYYKSYDGSCYDTNPAPFSPIDEYYKDKEWISFSPKGGIVYHLSLRTSFRISVGKAFMAPSLPRLYTVMQRGIRIIKGNPELDPEKLISYETGLEHWFLNNLCGRLNLYHSDGNDFISSRTIAPNTTMFDNITKVQMQGVETELKYKVTKAWSCFAGYTFNKSTVKKDEGDPTIEGNDLPFVPKHKASLGIIYDNPGLFTTDVCLRYVGRMYTDLKNTKEDMLDDYWTLDLKLSRKIGKNTKLSLSVENLFDTHYSLPSVFEEIESPGRIITAGLICNL